MAEFNKVPYSGQDLGVFLLESIATGLYKNRLNILREYAQNETDTGVADSVRIAVRGRDVIITGNGSGMSLEDVMAAKRIGFPSKDPATGPEAGFRHIGLWSGVSACETLYITTKKEKATESHVLKIDAVGLREEIDNRSQKSLLDVLSDHVFVKTYPVPPSQKWKHGTSVRLANIREDHQDLLNKDKITEFLARSAPLDFHPDFEHRDLLSEMIEAEVPGYKTVKFLVDETEVFRPPLVEDGVLGPPDSFKLDGGKQLRAFSWVCHHRKPRELEGELNWGLVYKWKGWTIGDAYTIQNLLTTEANRVRWMVGEVHVIDIANIRPNTEKGNFEPGDAAHELETWIAESVWSNLRRNVHKTSATNKAIERVQKATDLTATLPRFNREDAWQDHLFEVEQLIRSLERDSKTAAVLEKMKPKVTRSIQRLKAHSKRARQEYDEWKKGKGTSAVAKKETEVDEEEKTSGGEEEPTEKVDPEEILKEAQPIIERLARRARLGDEGITVLTACLRILARRGDGPGKQVKDFLALLELELGTGG